MFIETELTPNPATLKFIPDRPVLETGGAHFEGRQSAENSPLALAVFEVDGVSTVYLGLDFISVTIDNQDWTNMKPQILGAIMNHFSSGQPVMSDRIDAAEVNKAADSEIVGQIKAILNEKVKPAVARDGGDVVYEDFKDGILYLSLQGACSGCPSSSMTLQHGIKNLMHYYVPEVEDVRQI